MIKKRLKPNRISHPSVGTQGTIEARRVEAELKNLALKHSQIEHAVLSREQLSRWGFLVEVPDGPGGTRTSDEGQEATCERCQTLFVVRAPQSEQEEEELSLKCTYHWGRTYISKAAVGPHVFKDPEDFNLLHARHPYSLSSAFGHTGSPQPQPGTPLPSAQLDIAALDCEMIYTTAGMSLARVSVIDGAGKSVYDKLVKPDAGVAVLDYNTRFSGVKSLAEAELDLDGVRRELRKLIGPETILIGHA
ncbi:RNA exonuclease 3 [Ceratobasidium sp. 414]|nr:RNA exonuclease 3 [Ceratobasidium sp. 414]